MGYRLSGIGVCDAAGDDLGRLQCDRHGLRVCCAIGIDPDVPSGEARIIHRESDHQSPADPVHDEMAFRIRGRWPGPDRSVFRPGPVDGEPVEGIEGIRVRANHAGHSPDGDRHALGRPALEVEQSSLDHLLGANGEVRDRLLGVGVKLDPCGTVTGGDRHGTEGTILR